MFVDEPLNDDVWGDVHSGVLPDVIELFDFVFSDTAFGPTHAVGYGFEHGTDDHPFGVGLGHHFDHAGEIVRPVEVPLLIFGVLLEDDADTEGGLAVDEEGVGFVIGVGNRGAGHEIVDRARWVDEEGLKSLTPVGLAASFGDLVRFFGSGSFGFFDEFIDFVGEFFFKGVGKELDSFEDDSGRFEGFVEVFVIGANEFGEAADVAVSDHFGERLDGGVGGGLVVVLFSSATCEGCREDGEENSGQQEMDDVS